jgi:hypothetical protein
VFTRASLIEWACTWVRDEPPGQRERFREAFTREIENWSPPTTLERQLNRLQGIPNDPPDDDALPAGYHNYGNRPE